MTSPTEATETLHAPTPAITTELPEPAAFLAAFVTEATGNPDARPRPGQAAAFDAAVRAFDGRQHSLASLPTGSGKSAIGLAAAAHRAVAYEERTIISTESLSLLSQIIDKDAPTMIAACRALGVRPITVATFKGVSNYLDSRRLFDTANQLAGTTNPEDIAALTEAVAKTSSVPTAIDGPDIDRESLIALVAWGLAQYADPDAPGDRHSYPANHSAAEWALVSAASSAQAAKVNDTGFIPKALAAKERAAEADIVVTNHTMLGIQAAQGLPIVNGSAAIGVFQNIVVDEAHALPSEVRARGAAEVSGRTIHALTRAVSAVAEGAQIQRWSDDGATLASRLEQILAARIGGKGEPVRLADGDDPLDGIGEHITAWAGRVVSLLRPAASSPVLNTMLAAFRAVERADELCAGIRTVSEHRIGTARWVQGDDRPDVAVRWSSAQASLIDVSAKIRNNLWTLPGNDEIPDEPLGVLCMSATLPDGFQFEAGADSPVIAYPSPFAAAYSQSVLYIPAVTAATAAADIPALTSDRWGKRKFDTQMHTTWAADQIADLVGANDGSALVLSATAKAGRVYAEALRDAFPHLTVYSQWDGMTPALLLSKWRDEHDSVLVGTRSLMSGVDAPGQTCTLVILDRIPRAAGNPLDDARVESVMQRAGCDKWTADRLVYAADAALLEQQSVGRLIRAESDAGVCAVLDPRLVRTDAGAKAGISYQEQTRQTYASPLRVFPNRVHTLAEAVAWLEAHRAAQKTTSVA